MIKENGLRKIALLVPLLFLLSVQTFTQSLEIHQINVGWGNSTYVVAPNGKTILMDGGDSGMGTNQVKPYLQSISAPTNFDYVIGSHMHADHICGIVELLNTGGYTATQQYSNGSTYSSSCPNTWRGILPVPVRMPVNTTIDLGSGCSLVCVGNWDETAGNYEICDGTRISVSNENDKSIAILISCGGFQYLWTGDLGGGETDTACTGRSTSQADVETALINGIIGMGYIPSGGIDVLSVGHHGSESSTNANLKNLAMPEYAICATGRGQTSGWALPRKIVIDDVLLGGASCINPPATIKIFQTEEGDGTDSLGDRSYSGFCVGDIVITYSVPLSIYCINANGAVDYGTSELSASGLPLCQATDSGSSCTPPDTPGGLTISDISTCTQSGVQITWIAVSGATGYDLLVDSTTITDVTSPYTYTPGDTSSHIFQVRSKNSSTCTSSWSAAVSGSDGIGNCGTCTAPTQEVVETVNMDKSGFTWTNIAGADLYRVIRGNRSSLEGLLSSATDFSCYQTGIIDGSIGVDISSDDPSQDSDRCFYYLIQGYDCIDPDAYLGTAGNTSTGERIVNLPSYCQACASISASISSISPSNEVTLGTEQTFNGSGSGEGTLTYEWDFSYDGITFNSEGTGSSLLHTFDSTGTFTVALRVTDSCSKPSYQQAITTASVTINPSSTPAKVVISQVYGGGGNSGSTFKNDFIELFNAGGTSQVLTGWSVQYASAAGSTWSVTSISGSIPSGGYYLIKEAAGSGGTTELPTPDAIGTIPMGATAGKVALVNSTTTLSGTCPSGSSIQDFVGYGTTANCYEGSSPATAPSNANSISRGSQGCTDTNSNTADFSAGSPNPRNSSTTQHSCV